MTTSFHFFAGFSAKRMAGVAFGAAAVFAALETNAKTISLAADGDLAAAVAEAEDEDVIELEAATYAPTALIEIKNGVTIRGKGRGKTFVSGASLGNSILFKITDGSAKIESLTICNVTKTSSGYSESAGGVINMTCGTLEDLVISNNVETAGNVYGLCVTMLGKGLIRNCLFISNKMKNGGGNGYGGGVYMNDGCVEDCQFIDNTMNHYGDRGGGVYAKGGTVANCYFRGNGAKNGQYSDVHGTGGCGIYVDGAATVDSCLVVSNFLSGVYVKGGTLKNTVVTGHKTETYSATWPAGVYIKDGAMYNCTIYGNDSPCVGCGVIMEAGAAVNNIIYGNGSTANASVAAGCTFNNNIVNVLPGVGSNNIASKPLLADPDALDFTLTPSSPALNAGATLPDVPYDILGVTRPQGSAYDIGAYELELGDIFICAIVVSRADWPYGAKPSVSSQVIGAPDGAAVSYKWFLDGEELVGDTGPSVEFQQDLACGPHDVKLVVTIDGVAQPAVEKIGAISVRPTEVFVKPDGGNVSPYETEGKAARCIDDAMGVLWLSSETTGKVHIAAGDYAITNNMLLASPCQLLGAGRDATKIDLSATPRDRSVIQMGTGSVVRDLSLLNKEGSAEGVVINMTGGLVDNVLISNITQRLNSSHGVAIKMSDGVVTNSEICKTTLRITGGNGWGGGVSMSGGLVADCRIWGNRSGRYGYLGGGIYATDGTIRGCDIRDCGCTDWSYGNVGNCGGALYIDGNSVRAENCTIASNLVNGVYIKSGTLLNSLLYGNGFVSVTHHDLADGAGGGVHQIGGHVYNCTVAGNTNLQTAATSDFRMEKGTAKNNIALIASVTGGTEDKNCFNESVAFKNALEGDFHLKLRAKNCINMGDPLDYTAASVDLDGNPRIFRYGAKSSVPDCGCYESPYGVPGLVLILR